MMTIRILILLSALIGLQNCMAQEITVGLELVKDHKGDSLLDGMKTWRLYVYTPDSNYRVTAVFGSNEHPLEINSSKPFWQHQMGDAVASQVNARMAAEVRGLVYDSWVTVGMENNKSKGNLYFLESPQQPWTVEFEDGRNMEISDSIGGSWFALPDQPNTQARGSRVLIGQFTTAGKISGRINCQIRTGQEGSLGENYFDLEIRR
ncbi:MAG: hypothetical protein RL220_744 [Bacteroidota bacterium]